MQAGNDMLGDTLIYQPLKGDAFVITIADNFDSGNIECLDAGDPGNIRLAIRKDEGPEGFFQWFHFRMTGARGVECRLVIENAGQASYTKGWEGYRACASYDRDEWFRIDTEYRDGALILSITPEADSVYFAYFAPYSRERHRDLVAACQTDPKCRLEVLGRTVDGEEIDLLVIGDETPGKLKLWTIARQHPGESMAEWWMEGFLDRILDPDDPIARTILDRGVMYVVPNMNPDGSRRGHLRNNAAGKNLNRVWADPDIETSPEVYFVEGKMTETGVDFSLDVHGDEGLPYNFIAGADAIPNVTESQISNRETYEAALLRANPDFQREHGYPKAQPGQANMKLCSAHIASKFDCLSMTLEMPFKDNANAPDPIYGWSPERCRKLGASGLDALAAVIDTLR